MVVLSDQRFTCCFCLHVRTGTILLGVAQIIVHLVCISVMILMTVRPDLLREAGNSLGEHGGIENSSVGRLDSRAHLMSLILRILPGVADMQESLVVHRTSRLNKSPPEGGTGVNFLSFDDRGYGHLFHRDPVTGIESPSELSVGNLESDARFRVYKDESPANTVKSRRFSPYFALCLSAFSLAFCCFLVHGAVTRQPTHLLPFFFLQVFDFIISLLTVVNYMSSTTDVRLLLHTKNGTVYVNSTSLTFIVLSISCIMLAFKAYCLGIVWDCYKYLMLTNQTGGGMIGTWSRQRFSLLPTIWRFMGVGRPSLLSLHRGRTPAGGAGGVEQSANGLPDDLPPPTYNQSSDLPNYDDALKIPANAYAPPPYFKPSGKNKSTSGQPAGGQARETNDRAGAGLNSSPVDQLMATNSRSSGNDDPSHPQV